MQFSRAYMGDLITETMLVGGVNDQSDHLMALADYLAQLRPSKAYLSIPTRPPAEKWVRPPQEDVINRAYQILSRGVDHLEYLIGYEGNAFSLTGDVEEDLLCILSVHPMREDAVWGFLKKAGADWSTIQRLLRERQIIETVYEGKRFFVRRLR
jgi:wyosine [tRNA(Phe)-imidazoG37] synthetase (radical SAM superfamily)